MLCLSRKEGESIRVDGPCVITVQEIDSLSRVRIGIEADRTVAIVRTELESNVPWHPPGKLHHPDTKPATKLRGEGDD